MHLNSISHDAGQDLTDDSSSFSIENEFYRTASVARIGKFVTHLDMFRRITGRPGEIVECGVFKGASLYRWVKLRSLLENAHSRRIIGFDVFGKFPPAGNELDEKRRAEFIKEAGERGPSKDEIVAPLVAQNLMQNVELIEGDVLDTVPRYLADMPQLRISLLNLDVDLYEPTKSCLQHLFPHVIPGGIVLLDDYGAFPGANRAIEEFFAERGEVIEKLPFTDSISFVVKLKKSMSG